MARRRKRGKMGRRKFLEELEEVLDEVGEDRISSIGRWIRRMMLERHDC